MNNNTKGRTGKVINCFICGKEKYKSRVDYEKVKDRRHTCSKKCMREKMSVIRVEEIERKLGIDCFESFLFKKYHKEKLPSTDIAEIVYGKRHYSPNILRWMDKFGIERRSRSKSVSLQWVDNNERRKEQSDFMRVEAGVGTPTRDKIIKTMQTEEYKKKQSIAKKGSNNGMYGVTGKNHPKWNPEKTWEQRRRDRKLHKNTIWRNSVFTRDEYTCMACQSKRGGDLVAHHLNSYNWDVENRFNTDNGITLCEPCHVEFHKMYGFGDNTEKQFKEYLSKLKVTH